MKIFRRTVTVALVAALAAVSLTACVPFQGPTITETRAVADVTAVVLESSGDLTVRLGAAPSLEITAGQNAMPILTSESRDGVLHLGVLPSFIPLGPVTYVLTVTEIDEVTIAGSGDIVADFDGARELVATIAGSGDITGDGIDAKSVTALIAGSGNVTLSGSTKTADLTIAGSGDIHAENLKSVDASASVIGSGDIAVHATGTLSASISGSGSIRYTGGPKVDSSIAGSGDISGE
jgi:hypothetical protein